MADKCVEFDILGGKKEAYSNQTTIGICAIGVYQPHSDLSDMPCKGTDKLLFLYLKKLVIFSFLLCISKQRRNECFLYKFR